MDNRSMNDLIRTIRNELNSAVLGDVLDSMGFYHQFLPPEIRAITPLGTMAGIAMPVLLMDVYGPQEKPFGLLPEALDDLREGEVYVSSGAFHRSANWGELLTSAAKARGAAGAVVDGYHRDSNKVIDQRFPVFSRGAYGQDSGPRMRVADFRVPIEVGDVRVAPGDVVVGDADGVVIIPQTICSDAVSAAEAKLKAEKDVRRVIENGESVAAVFARHNVL